MRYLPLLLLLLVVPMVSAPATADNAREIMLSQTSFSTCQQHWRPSAARDEILPTCAVDPHVSRTGGDGSLRIECKERVQYGGWTFAQKGITPGSWYRFDAYYLTKEVKNERQTVTARLNWRDGDDERVGPAEYVYHTEDAGGGWRHVWAEAPAPDGATAVRLELFFGWSPGGTVWWDDVRFAEIEPPAPRIVKVATIHYRPQYRHPDGSASADENLREFCEWIARAAREKPDLICLPEGITMVDSPLTYVQAAEPIPGPTSRLLGEMAKKYQCYIEACYNERDGRGVYNTAILLDRTGKLVGKYRKLYIPAEEIEGGVTSGQEAPVFDTDFGKVGMMICWDVQYVEPAELMALKGAELIIVPIWGGDRTLIKARAIENHVFLVTSGYDVPSWIIDPTGKVLAEAWKADASEGGIAVAEIDLNRRYVDPWDGNLRALFIKQHREDLR